MHIAQRLNGTPTLVLVRDGTRKQIEAIFSRKAQPEESLQILASRWQQ